MIGFGEYKRAIINEFEIEINKRNTIIRYKEDVSIKQLIENIETYREMNKRKLNTFVIEHNDFAIIDKEYNEYRNNNIDMFYADNQCYKIEIPFKPKGYLRKFIENIFKK